MSPPRVGLLACDSIWEPLRARHGDYTEMFTTWLRGTGADFELVSFAAHEGHLPAHHDDCDAWIVSGSRAGVYEPLPWISPLTAFVQTLHAARHRLLGICFGHQLLAQALGGHTARAAGGWGLGNIALTLHDDAGWASPRRALGLYMAHQDQVVALPPGARWLAAAAHCRHAMFALDEHVLGFQPHPEFTAGFMRDMTLDPHFEVPDALRSSALESYQRPTDSALVGRWAAEFLGLPPGPATTPRQRPHAADGEP